MPSIQDWFFGSSPKLKKKPTGTAEQQAFGQNLIQQLNQMASPGGGQSLAQNYFNQLLGPNQQEAYNQFSSPYMTQFNEQILPGIAERFAGMGALSSSGFGQALGGAASSLQAQLAQLFSSLQQHAAGQQSQNYLNQANLGLNYQPFAYHEKPGSVGAMIPFITAMIQSQGQGQGGGAMPGYGG